MLHNNVEKFPIQKVAQKKSSNFSTSGKPGYFSTSRIPHNMNDSGNTESIQLIFVNYDETTIMTQ